VADPQVRQAAAQALAQSGDDDSVATLITMARDADESVRTAAMNGLGQLGSSAAVGALVDTARSSATAADRAGAVSSLANSDDSRALGLIAELMHDSDEPVAMAAIQAAYSGGEEAEQSLLAVLTNPGASNTLRSAAAAQLRQSGANLSDSEEAAIDGLLGAELAGEFGGITYGGPLHRHGW
jgi:HEAT repeat protein